LPVLPLFKTSETGAAKKSWLLPVFFTCVIGGVLIYYLPVKFAKTPIDYHIADMLPRIKIYADRFLQGRYVYDDVKEIWGGNLPPYFPAVWVPFIPSLIFGYEMRWTEVTAFIAGVFLLLRSTSIKFNMAWWLNLAIALFSFFLLNNFLLYFGLGFWENTYEGLIAFYYILLCISIISWNPYFIGFAISLCLLSRFSLSFWVPVFIIYLWYSEGFSFAAKVSAVIAAVISFILIIPFVMGHTDIFLKTVTQYTLVSEQFWKACDLELNLYNEVGLFKFFTIKQIPLMRHLQIATTLLAPISFLAIAHKIPAPTKTQKILIGLCSLKFTLLFFYNFIEAPYLYLFLIPAVISYAILFYWLGLSFTQHTEEIN
jgi:hypothetical protein